MRKKTEEKLNAIELRKKGFSVNEIAEKLAVSKGSISVWVRNIPLSKRAETRLLTKIKKGQLIAAQNKRNKTKQTEQRLYDEAFKNIQDLSLDTKHKELICALVYWCEGAKSVVHGLDFTNSDSDLVKLFLKLLRETFLIDEKKFRVCVHLHKYHSPSRQIAYWSKVTNIPKQQFIKPYKKPHTGKQIREGYQGCVSIRYHDVNMGRRLHSIAKVAFKCYL